MRRAVYYQAMNATFKNIADAVRALGLREKEVRKHIERGEAKLIPMHFVIAGDAKKTQP